jgi:hypothetical protein
MAASLRDGYSTKPQDTKWCDLDPIKKPPHTPVARCVQLWLTACTLSLLLTFKKPLFSCCPIFFFFVGISDFRSPRRFARHEREPFPSLLFGENATASLRRGLCREHTRRAVPCLLRAGYENFGSLTGPGLSLLELVTVWTTPGRTGYVMGFFRWLPPCGLLLTNTAPGPQVSLVCLQEGGFASDRPSAFDRWPNPQGGSTVYNRSVPRDEHGIVQCTPDFR